MFFVFFQKLLARECFADFKMYNPGYSSIFTEILTSKFLAQGKLCVDVQMLHGKCIHSNDVISLCHECVPFSLSCCRMPNHKYMTKMYETTQVDSDK